MRYFITGFAPGVEPGEYRPAGTDVLTDWSSVQFRPNPANPLDGFCIVAAHDDVATLKGGNLIATAKDERLSAARARTLANRIGLNLDATDFPGMLLELFQAHSSPPGDTSRWNALRSTIDGRHEIWLGGEKIVDLPVVSGGAVFTESFNKADSTTLGPDLTWAEANGNLQVLSNQADIVTTASNNFAVSTTEASTDNNYGQAVITGTDTTSTTRWSVTCRGATDNTTTYMGSQGDLTTVDNTGLYSWLVGITLTLIASSTHTKAANDVIKVSANGSSIAFAFNGTNNITQTDTTWTTGKRCGIVTRAAATGRSTLDSFEGGDLSTLVSRSRARRVAAQWRAAYW